jgi:hypothetical protein
VAACGTVTVRLVAVALITVARVAPKKTMLFAVVVLKPDPVIITELPATPDSGANEAITVGAT